MIRAAFHLSSYPPAGANRNSLPVESSLLFSLCMRLTFTDFLCLYLPFFSLIFRLFSGLHTNVVGISISELDCGYQREAAAFGGETKRVEKTHGESLSHVITHLHPRRSFKR